jgi:hypothetical protein
MASSKLLSLLYCLSALCSSSASSHKHWDMVFFPSPSLNLPQPHPCHGRGHARSGDVAFSSASRPFRWHRQRASPLHHLRRCCPRLHLRNHLNLMMSHLLNCSRLLRGFGGRYSTLTSCEVFSQHSRGQQAIGKEGVNEENEPLLLFLPIPSLSTTSSAHRIAGPLRRCLLLSSGSCAPRNRSVEVAIVREGPVAAFVWVKVWV